MSDHKPIKQTACLLDDGSWLRRSDLPDADCVRWVARRKAIVVRAIEHGLLKREEAMERYHLSEEELNSWIDRLTENGAAALKVGHLRRTRVKR
ncbi:DUF1153 domain-containing protein [Palleronia caenipelagi]|uniref:DUF1153 domain-containing protein n=1 Tax=Palleronia caenipelagi TaxID=2489174 RepID=A0A547Q626_9RHOB|nr:DUF1153 domain-containing protein [Palleronia caenipelagi]TRD21839.1 DUF1153 domain-containing protein [Palleronia caenipelagi]